MIQRVTNFNDLVSTPLKGSANVVCWERALIGDFNEIVQQCVSAENITVIEPELLRSIKLSAAGELARNIILNDFELLKA